MAEAKNLLAKQLEGEEKNWAWYLPVTQISLNTKIFSRTKLLPFAVMFGRKAASFANYGDVQQRKTPINDLLERNRKMLEVIYPSVNKITTKRASNYMLVGKQISIGATVFKKVDVRKSKKQQQWEGPFKVVAFNSETRGYLLINATGKHYKDEVPASHLKLVNFNNMDRNEEFEIK